MDDLELLSTWTTTGDRLYKPEVAEGRLGMLFDMETNDQLSNFGVDSPPMHCHIYNRHQSAPATDHRPPVGGVPATILSVMESLMILGPQNSPKYLASFSHSILSTTGTTNLLTWKNGPYSEQFHSHPCFWTRYTYWFACKEAVLHLLPQSTL